jgi:hypothetical protein
MAGEANDPVVVFATLMDCSVEPTGCNLYFKNGIARSKGNPVKVGGGVLVVCLHTPERCSTLVEYVLERIMFAALTSVSTASKHNSYIPRNVLL